MKKVADCPVVLVLEQITARQKEYLLREKIAFIVDGKQIYLPFMAAYLQERCDAEYIQESMKEVEFTILLTGIIVVLIIYLFLGDGMATLVPCATIPVSLIGTFFALDALGMSINLLSL